MPIKKIIYKIFPYYELHEKNHILDKKFDLLKNKEFNLDLKKINEENFLNELEKYEKNESNRQELIESKAKSTLFIITLVLTLLLGSINFIYQFNDKFNHLSIIILILGIIYFIFSIISIINVLKPEEYYNLYFNKRYNIKDELFYLKELKKNKKIKYQPLEISNKNKICTLVKSIKLNEYTISKKANSLDCTFELIERGIFLIAIFSILLLLNFLIKT